MFIDIHCHLGGNEYDELGGADGVIEDAKRAGVEILVLSGSDYSSSLEAKEIAEKHDGVYFCAGFHPGDLKKVQEEDYAKLETLASHEKCVAIGEIGLDYHFADNPPKEEQKIAFLRQLELAHRLSLPVVVHSREACKDTLDLLEANATLLSRGGLMHCYSYSPEEVVRFEKLGMYFSFGGTCTFKNARKVQDSACKVRIDRLLSETDSPYLSPEPYRGKFPNLPSRVVYSVEKLASLRGEEVGRVQLAIEENAKRLFSKIKR